MSIELPTRRVGALVELCTEKASGTKRSDFRYVGLEHMETDSPFLLGTAPAAASTSTNNVFDQDDILFGKLRPYLRKSVRAPFAGYCSTDILVLRANPDVDARFAAKVFQSDVVFDHATATSIGTRMPRTSWSSLSELEVFCPHAIGEQRRIAEILDTLDEAIRATEALIAKLEQVKKGLLHDLLTRGIDDNGELRDPERHPEQFKDSPLGRIPREWDVCPLLDLAEVRSGIAKNSNRALNNPVDVHYLRVANVQDGFLDLSEMSKIRINRAEVAKYAVQAGDVLMNEGGDLDKLGRGALWRGEYHPCVHQNHVFVVRCGGGLEPAFLDAWTGSAPARRYFIVAGKQTTNLASINKTAISQLPVALPPMREQRAIVQRLDGHRERVLAEEQSLTKLRLLKTGLMDDLLSGRVRVSVESQEVSA